MELSRRRSVDGECRGRHSESALAQVGGHRRHDGWCVDQRRLGHALRAIRHEAGDEEGRMCWHHSIEARPGAPDCA